MAQLTLQDILRMMGAPQSSGLGQASNTEMARMNPMEAALVGAGIKGMPKYEGMGNVSDMEMQRLAQSMGSAGMAASPAPFLPANEMQPNYADGEMPLYTGGLLQNPQGEMVDPQMLMNVAYDMSAPREMRINAIERLRALGVI
jgi:hypothetical protein